jgi:hypothetical protein
MLQSSLLQKLIIDHINIERSLVVGLFVVTDFYFTSTVHLES